MSIRISKQARHFYEFGPFRLDSGDRTLLRDGRAVEMPPQSMGLLFALIERVGRVASREDLEQIVWPGISVGETSLPKAVEILRKALNGEGSRQKYIETVPRRGYRFRAEVKEAWDPGPVLRDATAPELKSTLVSNLPTQAGRLSRRRVVFIALSIISAFLIIAFVAISHVRNLRRSGVTDPNTQVLTRPHRRSVAVFGIQSVPSNSRNEWLSTAVGEMLTTELAADGSLRVLSQDNVVRLQADLGMSSAKALNRESLKLIRTTLGADLVASGTCVTLVRSGQDFVRLDLRIQDASTGDLVASAAETGKVSELFDIVLRAGARVRDKLQIQELSPQGVESARASIPLSDNATRLYAQGLDRLRSFDLLAARDVFERVVKVEPRFPLAHMRLSETWSALGYDMRAKDEAVKAFDLAGTLSQEERLWIEGNYREKEKEWDLSIGIYRRLWSFFPDDVDYGLALVSAQTSAAKQRDALIVIDDLRRLALAPGDQARVSLAEALASDGFDHERELKASRAAKKEGDFLNARLLVARASLLESYALQDEGRDNEASNAVGNAERLFSLLGDRVGYARALIHESNLLRDKGDFAQRKVLYSEALEVCRVAGNRRCEAVALNNLGGILQDQGDSEAEKRYQESLLVLNLIGDKARAANVSNNIGTLREGRGDLRGARTIYENALLESKAVGDKAGQSMELDNISGVLRRQGNLIEAKTAMEESLKLAREADLKGSGLSGRLASMADIQFHEGNLDEAEKLYEQSISLIEGEEASADARTQLAAVWIEKGRLADAEVALRQSRKLFDREHQRSAERTVNALLIKDLLRAGKVKEAQAEAESAASLQSDTQDFLNCLPLAIALAEVQAAEGNLAEAKKSLHTTLDTARKLGFVGYALDARLVLGRIEMKSGSAAGRTRLKSLQSEAQARGFGQIARQAGKLIM